MFNKSAKTKIIFGILTLVILSSSIYFLMPDKAKILIEDTRTKYFVYENEFVLSATEYVNIYDGTKKMRANSREVIYWNDSKNVYAQRISKWKDDIATIQTYTFSQTSGDIEQFPVKNEFQCLNCQGKIVHYEIRDIKYDGETKQINSPFSFGHNMKIEWGDGAYYSKVFQQKSSDKIIIKYRPKDDNEIYNVRLFDPPVQAKTLSSKYNVTFEFSKLGIIDKCLDISIQNLQDTSDNLDLKTILNEANFDINNVSNLVFQEWKPDEIIVNDTETICNPYNETIVNETTVGNWTTTIIEHQNCTTNIIGNHTEEVWSWETKSLTKSEKEGQTELRNTWEQVAIQKAGQTKDTKNFRLCFSTPIIQSSGWGNKGTFYLDLNGETFWDKTHSSWFNESWSKTRQLGNLTGNFSYMNISYSDITEAQPDFDDLRFTNTANDTELNFTISDKVDSSWVTVRVHNYNDTIYMYYGNADVSTTSSASDTYFNPVLMYYLDEASGVIYDKIGSNNATNNGGVYGADGIINTGIDCETDDTDYLTSNAGVGALDDFTVSFRFKPENWTSAQGDTYLWSIGYNAVNSFIMFIQSNKIMYYFKATGSVTDTGDAPPATGSYHHFLLTREGTAVELWVDGVKTHTSTESTTALASLKFELGWAVTRALAGTGADGIFDEPKVFNKVLSDNQIYQLYTQNEPSYTLGAEESAVVNCDFSGYVFDEDSNALNNSQIKIWNQNNISEFYETTSDANGLWTKNIVNSTKTYMAGAYYNNTLIGQLKPYISGSC